MTISSSHKRVIYQLINNQNITIDNFRSVARPIIKPASVTEHNNVDRKQFTFKHPVWYCSQEVETEVYSNEDIDAFNNNLWVERGFCTEVLKLLKKVGYDKNPYDVFIEIFGLSFVHYLYDVPKSKLVHPTSTCQLVSLLNEFDDFEIRRHRIKIKSNNLRRSFDFDTETLPFIKEAITFYLQSDEGIQAFNKIKQELEELESARIFVKSIQECMSNYGINYMQQEFARSLNTLFTPVCNDNKLRYEVIGELMLHATGPTRHYEKAVDKARYHYEKIRKLLAVSI